MFMHSYKHLRHIVRGQWWEFKQEKWIDWSFIAKGLECHTKDFEPDPRWTYEGVLK